MSKHLSIQFSKPGAAEEAEDLAEEVKLEEKIKYHLTQTGKRDALKQKLAEQLAACGWRDEIKQRCREYITKKGRENVSTDEIVKAVRPEARSRVPDSIKAELLADIKKFILEL